MSASSERDLELLASEWRLVLPDLKLVGLVRRGVKESRQAAAQLGARGHLVPSADMNLAERGVALAQSVANSIRDGLENYRFPLATPDEAAEAVACWAIHVVDGVSIRRTGRIIAGDLADGTWTTYRWDSSSAPEQRARQRMWLDVTSRRWKSNVTVASAEGIRTLMELSDRVLDCLHRDDGHMNGPLAQWEFQARRDLDALLQMIASVDEARAASVAARADIVDMMGVRVDGPLDLSGCVGRLVFPEIFSAESIYVPPYLKIVGITSMYVEKDFVCEGVVDHWPRRLWVGGDLDVRWASYPQLPANLEVRGSIRASPM